MAKNPCIYHMKDGRKLSYDEVRQYMLDNYDTLKNAAPPPKPPKGKTAQSSDEEDAIKMTHEATRKAAEEFGLPVYEKTTKSKEQLDKEADDYIRNGVDLDKLLNKPKNGEGYNDVETIVLIRFGALYKSQANANPKNENINKYQKVRQALDLAGTIQGRGLAARRWAANPEISLVDYLVRQKQESKVEDLTDEQIAKNTEEYNAIKKAAEEWERKYTELLQKYEREAAEHFVRQQRRNSMPRKGKTSAEFKKERDDIRQRMREKLAKMKGQTSVTILPYADRLVAISPEVAMLAKSYIEEGIVDLANLVRKIHADVKGDFDEVTENDIMAVLAGRYDAEKKTKNEAQSELRMLKREAELLTQLMELEKGEWAAPSTPKKQQIKNQKIFDIKEKMKSYPEYNLAEQKKKFESQIRALEKGLADNSFLNERPKIRVKLDAEAKALKARLVELKTEREIRLLKDAYERQGLTQKAIDKLVKLANVPRSIMASMDYSAPFRQAIIATIANPKIAAKAFVQMFKASFRKASFDEWYFDLEQDPRYDMMQELGLGISDPKNPFLRAKEEAFMSGYVENVEKMIGRKFFNSEGFGPVQSSERAYVLYLNKMRVDIFNRLVDQAEAAGYTMESDPELFKSIAGYVNNITGRGTVSKTMEGLTPYLSVLFFSPRLIASRLNLLNPVYFAKLPTMLKKQYAKDMISFIAFNSMLLGLNAVAFGGDDDDDVSLELDPRSTDFMKLKKGNTRWDVWGGFQQYIRATTQILFGQRLSERTDEIVELDGEGPYGESRGDVAQRFLRGKLAPVPSAFWDLWTGRDVMGQEVTIMQEAKDLVVPLIIPSFVDVIKEQGASAALTAGLPSVFGVGVETHLPREREAPKAVSINGNKIKLTEQQQAVFKEMLNKETDRMVSILKTTTEYKEAKKSIRAEMETAAKRLSLASVKKNYIRKNYNQLISQAEMKDDEKEKAKKFVKEYFRKND